MADVKVSGLPSDSALDGNHYVPVNDPTGPTTKRTLLSVLAAFFFDQINIPDGSGSPRTRMTEFGFDFVASGLVWSGDAYASTRNASMTSGICYVNGRRLVIAAVSARSFTASKDVYVGIKDNADGTGTVIYYDNTTNAASPSLATAGYDMLIAIIVVGATNILSVASVNQGQETKILPIASSIPYTVTDSLGNLICPRDPSRKVLGYKQITTDFTTTSTTAVQVTGLSCPVIVPTGRKVKVSIFSPLLYTSAGTARAEQGIWDGAVGGTQIGNTTGFTGGGSATTSSGGAAIVQPTTSNKTYNVSLLTVAAGTAHNTGSATAACYILVELL